MPILENAKYELFAQAIVRGKSGRSSYKESGHSFCSDSTADVAASRLLKNPKVSARIAELRERQGASQRVVLTKAWVIEQVIELANQAREGGAYGPAAKCLELLGREVNAFVEKSEVGLPGEFSNLSESELRSQLNELSGKARNVRPDRPRIGAASDKARLH